jgi:hypothetical protein
MILRLCANQEALHRREQMLALRQRQPDHPRLIFGHRRWVGRGASMADPVQDGLVVSLARPDGNITGTTLLGPELVAKCRAAV